MGIEQQERKTDRTSHASSKAPHKDMIFVYTLARFLRPAIRHSLLLHLNFLVSCLSFSQVSSNGIHLVHVDAVSSPFGFFEIMFDIHESLSNPIPHPRVPSNAVAVE